MGYGVKGGDKMRFLLTGTQVFGLTTKESDIDIVMLCDDAIDLRLWLVEHSIGVSETIDVESKEPEKLDPKKIDEIVESEGYKGFYFSINKLRFNIIITKTDEELTQWETATNAMKKIEPITNRKERINTFKLAKEI